MKENIEIKNIKEAYAGIMRDHTAVEALKYSDYSKVPRWLNITNMRFMIIKRTEALFKLTEEKETILKELDADIPLKLIDNLSKEEMRLHLDLMYIFGKSLREIFNNSQKKEGILFEKGILNKAIDNGNSKKPMTRI